MTTVTEHRSEIWLCSGLAFVGGYADAASYTLAGTLTGHVTGNSVLAAVSLASHDWLLTISRLLAIGAFLLGIPLILVVERLVKDKPYSSLTVALFLEATLMFITAGLGVNIHQIPNRAWFVILMCLALGLQNAALRKANSISVHTTYITGTVTKLLEYVFDPLKSDREHRRIALSQPPPTDPTCLLSAVWLAFVLGAGAGAGMGLYFKRFTVTGVAFLVLSLAFFNLQGSARVSPRR